MKMKKLLTGAMALALAVNTYAVSIAVTPWSAPNAFGSPSYAGAVANNIHAQVNGLTSYGNPALPTYYQAAPANMQVKDNIVTGFPSWKGSANPVGDYGAAYSAELGNRLLFGIVIDGEGSQFSINQLSFAAVSTDSGNTLNFAFGAGSYNYSQDYQGWLYGGDGAPGGGDDSFITSGLSSQLVDGLVGRGSGNAWAVYDASDPVAGTRQDKIDAAVAELVSEGEFTFTGTYTLGAVSGSGGVTFNARGSVPDTGSTLPLLAAGFAGIGFMRRKLAAS